MKYIGIAILAVLSIAVGRICSMRIVRRTVRIEEIILMLEKIKTHLNFCNSSVEEIMEIIIKENKESLSFAEKSLETYKNGSSFSESWEQGIDSKKLTCFIKKEDVDLLKSFGRKLGTTDLNGQIGICELYISLFTERLKEARESGKKYSKLYSKLGYIGAALIITLLF